MVSLTVGENSKVKDGLVNYRYEICIMLEALFGIFRLDKASSCKQGLYNYYRLVCPIAPDNIGNKVTMFLF